MRLSLMRPLLVGTIRNCERSRMPHDIHECDEHEHHAHVHEIHECDEHEHHGDEPGHVHDIHECDDHEHHAHVHDPHECDDHEHHEH